MEEDKKRNKNRTIAECDFPNEKVLECFWNKRYDNNFHTEVLGRLNKYDKIKCNIKKWYKLQDDILNDLFDKRYDRTIQTTFLRVKLLNEFYSTNVPDICIYNVAYEISKNDELHKQIMKPQSLSD